MAGYNLSIKNIDEVIELSTGDGDGKQVITEVSFKINTLDDNTRNRADAVRGELKISGVITPENRDITKLLAKWAIDADRKTLYRNVEIVVYDSKNCTGDVLRRYQLTNMFVIDYEENFGGDASDSGDSDSGTFFLFIAQKEGNEKKEVFSS